MPELLQSVAAVFNDLHGLKHWHSGPEKSCRSHGLLLRDIESISGHHSTLPPINMEAHIGPYIEDSSLVRGPSPLPCSFGGVCAVGFRTFSRTPTNSEGPPYGDQAQS